MFSLFRYLTSSVQYTYCSLWGGMGRLSHEIDRRRWKSAIDASQQQSLESSPVTSTGRQAVGFSSSGSFVQVPSCHHHGLDENKKKNAYFHILGRILLFCSMLNVSFCTLSQLRHMLFPFVGHQNIQG